MELSQKVLTGFVQGEVVKYPEPTYFGPEASGSILTVLFNFRFPDLDFITNMLT